MEATRPTGGQAVKPEHAKFNRCLTHGLHGGSICPLCRPNGATPRPPAPVLTPQPIPTQPKQAGYIILTVPGNPMGKPRMTQRDKWKKRPSVMRYRAWADSAREALEKVHQGDLSNVTTINWKAFFEIPKSWSKKKREAHLGKPHRQKPDRDNIDKCVLDALLSQDCGVSDGKLSKRWDDGFGPRLEIEIVLYSVT